MEIYYHFDCEFPAVFLVNGVFFERLNKLKTQPLDSLYITALPLDALYLPYTVRLGGGEVFAGQTLIDLYRLRDNRYLVRLLPRFNYVYTPNKHRPPAVSDRPIKRLFQAVKERDAAAARTLLTPALSASIDDNSLLGFFDGYVDCVENNGYVSGGNELCFLIPDDNKETASLCRVEYAGGLIDDIKEQ